MTDKATITKCRSCGESMIGTREVCNQCVGAVPVAELEALADEWFERESKHDPEPVDEVIKRRQELKTLIEEYADE